MRGRWQGICLWAVAGVLFAVGCHAQSTGSVTPEDEYKQLIKVNQDIQPLGAHPFGENISLYNGTLSFEETDVSLPGNGPTIKLGRSLAPEVYAGFGIDPEYPFSDWDLDIPRIETITASPMGWKTSTPGTMVGDAQRCSNFTPPPYAPSTVGGGGTWDPDQFWYGYHLLIPGQGSQELMPRASANGLSPTISGMSFPIVTKNNWMIGCGVTASDGGEGFLAIAPDGTRYTFAHLVYRPAAMLAEPVGTPPPPDVSAQDGVQPMMSTGNLLDRQDALMYVTKIQDRFGNTLTYNYSGNNLTSIVASDGREVDLTYASGSPLVQTVTAKATNVPSRTWTYSYGTGLTGVTLPDGSAWSYNLSGIDGTFSGAPIIQPNEVGDCESKTLPTLPAGTVTGSITHPSGLTATFTLTPMLHGRSYVHWECYGGQYQAALYPDYYAQYSMTSEVLSGAGMPTQTWSYSYSPMNESWDNDACATAGTCATTIYTDVTDPGGNDTRYTFSNKFDVTEGQLKRTDYYSGAASGAPLRSVVNTYADPTGGPWPTSYGVDLQARFNTAQTTEVTPLSARQITQDGETYTWQATAFNAYADATEVSRSNNIAGQQAIEETTSYLNDTSYWVLGLPQTVTNVGTGEVESSNTYNSLDELTARARFGQPLMSYTWNSAGQLASFTDGDSHTTTLGSYVRGIPTAIAYPDGSSESLAVDDLGQITAITDQLGNTTNYSYDAIGRIAKISYPYDSSTDSASWYPKTFSYSYVTGAERGLAADHWRRTTTQGAATDTTYFDAELRPVLDDTSDGSTDISTATSYDWRGLTTFASYPVSGSPALSSITTGAHSTYDALGRLTQTQQDSELGALTTSTAYLSGARKQVTDPKGNVTTTTYQVFDQPTYGTVLKVQAPTGITQTTTRDVYGNPLSITQSGNYGTESDSVTKTLMYDSYKRLCRTTEPETGSTIMAYDGANNLAWSAEGVAVPSTETDCAQNLVPAAAQTTRTYDAMNRVLTVNPPSGTQSTTYTYDKRGELTQTVSGVSLWWAVYNSLGQPTGEALWVSGQNAWGIGYSYDAYDHLAAVSYPAGTGTSESVTYAPNAWGQPTRVGSYATGISYFPNGQVQSFTYGNGTSYLADQNARQLTRNFTDGAGSTLALSEDLSYDADGNLTTINDLVDGTRSKSFGYDALNRLTSAQAPKLYGTENYAYDALNNLRQEVISGDTFNLNPDANNRLVSMTAGSTPFATYQNDDAGNRTAVTLQGNTTGYTWDAKHQLLSVSSNGANVEGYAYDAQGRRVEKVPASGSPTYSFYNHAGQLMYRYDPGVGLATNYIYLGTKLIARDANVQLAQPGGIGFGTNPTAGSTTVNWSASPTATSYTLQQSSNAGSSWSTVYSGSATSTTVSGLAGGGYLYRVQACVTGNCSAWTTSGTLGVWPAVPAISVPTGTVNGAYTVSWTASAGSTGYTVQESLNSGAWATIATNTAATAISRPGTATGSYTYRVEASNTFGTAGWSATSHAVSVNTAYGVVPTPLPTYTVPATNTTGGVTVSWSASAPVTGYTLQQSSNGGTSWSTVYAGTATSVALSGLGDGSYTYRLQACNDTAGDTACTAWVAAGPMVVVLPPPTPASISVPATSSGPIAISWAASATATYYDLYQEINGADWQHVYGGNATSVTLQATTSGTYNYWVAASNASGWSGVLRASSAIAVTIPPASAPSLSVPATSSTGSYTVSWGAVSGATSYTLQQSSNGGSSWSTAYSGSALSKVLSGIGNGTYTYRVEACNAGGCGAWSAAHAITVALIPAEPASITVPGSATYTVRFTVSWASVSGATSYTLQRTNTVTNAVVTVYTGSATSASDGGPAMVSGTYVYAVKACNGSGCSGWRDSSAMTVVCLGASVATKPGSVQPDLAKCGSAALSTSEGGTP